MRALARWLFGDIVSVVAPRVERGPRRAPTRRSARRLIALGVFVTLFGAIGFAGEAGRTLERQPATVLGRFTTELTSKSGGSTIHHVRLELEDGTTTAVRHAPLYDAVGRRTGVRAAVDIEPDIDLIDAVYLDGRRYGTGRKSAALVITLLFTALGAFLLLRGIGRHRRSRLLEYSTSGK
jgi:hypothetical protein